jgi:DnaD/phage-associated family protein
MEFHQTMPKHRKTIKLAKLLGISRREAIGLMCDLWTWAIDNADKYGGLHDMGADDIATALDWPFDKADFLLSALKDSEYVDQEGSRLIIHDWYDYCGKLNDKRETDRKRKAESSRKSDGIPTEIQRKSSGIPLVTVPNSTVPNIYTPTAVETRTRDAPLLTESEQDAEGQSYRDNMAAIEAKAISMKMPFGDTDRAIAESYMADYSAEWVLEAMSRAVKGPARTWAYIEAILKRWKAGGGIDGPGAHKPSNQLHGADTQEPSGGVHNDLPAVQRY